MMPILYIILQIIIFLLNIIKKCSRSSIGRAELWRCLGCKFESYLEQLKVVMELVDMNSLGLFDF
jgi:hypothetical protein